VLSRVIYYDTIWNVAIIPTPRRARGYRSPQTVPRRGVYVSGVVTRTSSNVGSAM
jgi:hypothetical protein